MINISKIRYNLKQWINIPYATYLCIRFPFLYPRNRFTGKHYSNWYIQNKISNIHKKYTLACVKSIHEPTIEPYFDNKRGVIVYSLIDTIKIYLYECIHKILSIFYCLPTYTELDAMDKGWKKAFGIQMCKEIKVALKQSKQLYSYRIDQIKEKFGALRWYDSGSNKEVQDIIKKYEYISYYTCIVCGKPAHFLTNKWISPFCEEHAPHSTMERREFYGWRQGKYKIKGDDKNYSYDELYGNLEDCNKL